VSDSRIPLSDLAYGPEEQSAVERVLAGGWITMGPEVEAFEREFAAMLGARHALAVANGTAAIHLSYLALGLGPGDEIVQPAINFVAAANLSVMIGAHPVFADIVALDEPTIDPGRVEAAITPATRAVVVMHYGGYLCRMAEITAVCEKKNVALIEDACHAVGARHELGTAGTIGDISCFSFFGNKNMATGEGGMVVTNRDELAEKVRHLRSHGMTSLSWDRRLGHTRSYDVVTPGFNYRLDDLHAALGRSQLAKLPVNNKRRGHLVAKYRKGLDDLPGWTTPFASYRGDSAYHLMTIVAPDQATRELVVEALAKRNVQTSLHYPFIPHFKAFQSVGQDNLGRSDAYASRAITLPLYPGLQEEQVERVVTVIRDAVD
jgi:dTDP-4-amino-4,6-dideoxygalactose transaminase